MRSVYQANFMGLPISRSFVTMTYGASAYHIEGNGRSSAVVSILTPMKANFEAIGSLEAGAVHPANFAAHIEAGTDKYDIALEIQDGVVTDERVHTESPGGPFPSKPDFVPITENMKRGIVDPLSAFLVPYKTSSPEKVCARTLSIYTGRERFNLALTPLRREKVSIPGLYEGEAQVCAARYKPLGGHRAQKKEVKYMIANKDMEAWFVPLPEAKLMGLYKVKIGTKFGPVTVTLEKAGLGPVAPIQ